MQFKIYPTNFEHLDLSLQNIVYKKIKYINKYSDTFFKCFQFFIFSNFNNSYIQFDPIKLSNLNTYELKFIYFKFFNFYINNNIQNVIDVHKLFNNIKDYNNINGNFQLCKYDNKSFFSNEQVFQKLLLYMRVLIDYNLGWQII
jgi:hypothetical protein